MDSVKSIDLSDYSLELPNGKESLKGGIDIGPTLGKVEENCK
jgi:hypothetical protein